MTSTSYRAAISTVGALTKHRPEDDPELVSARRTMHEIALAEYIERALAKAPPLTDEQRTRLAELLRPVQFTHPGGGA